KSSRSSPPAQSPRSPASDAPCGDGKTRSLPTSPPTGPTTAPQKRSTASSNSTDASPADSETARTTDYECSWPAGASPTTNSDEPLICLVRDPDPIEELHRELLRLPRAHLLHLDGPERDVL